MKGEVGIQATRATGVRALTKAYRTRLVRWNLVSTLV